MEEHVMKVDENRMLRIIFGLKRDGAIRVWRGLHVFFSK
jgi:hypothetical protein